MKSFFYTFVLSYLFLGCQDSEEFSISNKQPLQNHEIWVLNNVNNFLNSINQLTRSFGQSFDYDLKAYYGIQPDTLQ